MSEYDVVWGSGDVGANGIYRKSDGAVIVSAWTLRRRYDTDSFTVARYWSDGRIAQIAEEVIAEELLEACRTAVSFIDDDADAYPPPHGLTESGTLQKLHAAIAKAQR